MEKGRTGVSRPTLGKSEQPQDTAGVPSMPLEPTLRIDRLLSPTPTNKQQEERGNNPPLNVPGVSKPDTASVVTMPPPEITTTAQIKNLMEQGADEKEYNERGETRPPRIMSSQQFAETIEKAVKKAGLTPEQQQELQSQADEERKSKKEQQQLLAEERSNRPSMPTTAPIR